MYQLNALLISIIIEAPVSALSVYLMRKRCYGRAALVAVGSTLISHPLAWAANTIWLTHMPFSERALIIEIAVVSFEALFYRWLLPLNYKESFIVSLIANGASFGFGLLMYLL